MTWSAGVIALVGAALIEAGLTWTGLVIAALAMAVFHHQAAITEYLDRGPAVDVIEHYQEGLTDRGVQEFNVLHNEYKQLQEEKRKEAERKVRQRGKSGGKSFNKQYSS